MGFAINLNLSPPHSSDQFFSLGLRAGRLALEAPPFNLRQTLARKPTFRLLFAPCKGIRIPESGKALLVESETRESFAWEIRGILGFGIRNTAHGIWNPGTKVN